MSLSYQRNILRTSENPTPWFAGVAWAGRQSTLMKINQPDEWIDASHAAERLGVKTATLYAYVSRGMLRRRRTPDGRRSLFDPAEIEELARRGRPRRAPGAAELVIESEITTLGDDRPYYRGHDALRLAESHGFEEVAHLLWTGDLGAAETWPARMEAVAVARAAQAALPPDTLPLDRLQVIAAALATSDPLRLNLDPPAVHAAGRNLIAGMVESLPPASAAAVGGGPDAGLREARVARLGDDEPIVPGSGDADSARPGHPNAIGGRSPSDASVAEVAGSRAVAGFGGAGGGAADVAGSRAAADSGGVAGLAGSRAVGGSGGAGGGADVTGSRPVAGSGGVAGVADSGEAGGGAGRAGPDAGIAGRLWSRLTGAEPQAEMVEVLRAALVLLADHELAASTLAVRVAASVRADPYAAVGAGLGVVGGTLHGGESLAAETMLAEIGEAGQAARVVGERLRRGERLSGVGASLYRDRDGRAAYLLDRVRAAAPGHDRLAVAEAVLTEARARRLPEPGIDFALATLASVAGMTRGAGEAIFAVARTAGWLAHALEEYARETPMRLRAVYTGPPPAR
jgi:citrate synthase